jgi:hypothetical protein
MKKSPYLSIVIAARNDNYGGDFNQRIQNFISWNTDLLEKNKIETEIIIVNWNPIEENPSLQETLIWPDNRNFVSYRIVTVPNEIHQQYVNTKIRKTVPLFEFIAKNAGIKRAEGLFVLGTNADILFSEELIKEMSLRNLKENTIYRSSRVDFVLEKNEKIIDENQIKSKATNFFLKGGTLKLKLVKSFKVKMQLLTFYNKLRLLYYNIGYFIPFIPNIMEEELTIINNHFNASGDFSLMHKNDWNKIAGHLEECWISTHVDSCLVLDAINKGLEIEEYDSVLYHQEHQRRFNFQEQNNDMDKMYSFLLERIKKNTQKETTLRTNWGLTEYKLHHEQF